MKRTYRKYKPQKLRRGWIASAIAICEEYARAGYNLTVRQLYYQFVARDLLANTAKNYDRLKDTVDKARLGGFIDWNHIVDRTRRPRIIRTFDSPAEAVEDALTTYRRNLWANQKTYIEIWVEKEALAGVIEPIGDRWGITTFSCRGYSSQSAMWRAARRIEAQIKDGKQVVILHLGDHDPSGVHMTEDIRERMTMFLKTDWAVEEGGPKLVRLEAVKAEMEAEGEYWDDEYEVRSDEIIGTYWPDYLTVDRVALNMDQVEEYDPPPNPAKEEDSRFAVYQAEFGDESWELDALPPDVLDALLTDRIDALRDDVQWDADEAEQTEEKGLLQKLSEHWDEAKEWIAGLG